jgi:hypothetical protein
MLSWIFPTLRQSIDIPSAPTSPAPKIVLEHAALDCLRDLIEIGGGGSWPPRATYEDSWPLPLKAYNSVFRAMETSIPVEEPSLDHTRNRKIIDLFRARMRSQLEHHISIEEVEVTLERWQAVDQSGWLGFFACMSFLRHAYRFVHIVSACFLTDNITGGELLPSLAKHKMKPVLNFPASWTFPGLFYSSILGSPPRAAA